jgi:hypothetical protein
MAVIAMTSICQRDVGIGESKLRRRVLDFSSTAVDSIIMD